MGHPRRAGRPPGSRVRVLSQCCCTCAYCVRCRPEFSLTPTRKRLTRYIKCDYDSKHWQRSCSSCKRYDTASTIAAVSATWCRLTLFRCFARVAWKQCLGYLSESLETCEIAPEPADQNGRALFERLQILDLAEQLSRRVLDLKKNLGGAQQELAVGTAMVCSPHSTLYSFSVAMSQRMWSRSAFLSRRWQRWLTTLRTIGCIERWCPST